MKNKNQVYKTNQDKQSPKNLSPSRKGQRKSQSPNSRSQSAQKKAVNFKDAGNHLEEYEKRMREEKKKRLMKETRYIKVQSTALKNVQDDFQNHFQDFDLIVDTASQLFMQEKSFQIKNQNLKEKIIAQNNHDNQTVTSIQEQAAALLLPPLVKLTDENDQPGHLDLDPKLVLKNKALKDKDFEMYQQIDKFKRDIANFYVQLENESEVVEQNDQQIDQMSSSLMSNEFWDDVKQKKLGTPKINQTRRNTVKIQTANKVDKNLMNKNDFDDVLVQFSEQKQQVMDNSRQVNAQREGSFPLNDERLGTPLRSRTQQRHTLNIMNREASQLEQIQDQQNRRDMLKQATMVTQEDLELIKKNHKKELALVKRAAAVQMRNIKLLAREKAKSLIDLTVNRINEQFQEEILSMLLEYSDLKEIVTKKEREIRDLGKRLVEQEQEILLRNTRLISAQIVESNKEKQILDLEEPLDESQPPMSEKVDSFYEKRSKNPQLYKEPWIVQKGCPKHLSNPFNFYGGYVSLNLKEKATVAESSIVVYYKQCLIDMNEQNQVLDKEITILKDLNLSYYIDNNKKDDMIKELNAQIQQLNDDKKGVYAMYEGRIKQMFLDFFAEKQQIDEEFIKEKNLLQEELKLNEVIKEQYQTGQEKLKQELKELKRIIKIPRMHFKYLEKLEYDEIINQMKDFEEKQGEIKNLGNTGNLLNSQKKMLKKHIRNLSQNSKEHPMMSDSVTSFFKSPIQGQITKKHQLGLVQATTAPGQLMNPNQFTSNDMIMNMNQSNYGMYQTNQGNGYNSGNYLQYINTLSKKESLSSRSNQRQRRNFDMSQTQVGFNQTKRSELPMSQGDSQILNKERHLKQRLGNLTSLSPRRQTVFTAKPSAPNICTPSTQRVTNSVVGNIPQSDNNSQLIHNQSFGMQRQLYIKAKPQISSVLSGSNEGIVRSHLTKESLKGSNNKIELNSQTPLDSKRQSIGAQQYNSINFVHKKRQSPQMSQNHDTLSSKGNHNYKQ